MKAKTLKIQLAYESDYHFNKDLNIFESIHWAYIPNNQIVSIFNIPHLCPITL